MNSEEGVDADTNSQNSEPINTEQPQEEAIVEDNSELPKVTIDKLRQQLQDAETRADSNHDLAMRTAAEMENLRKRTQKDLEKAHKYGLEKFAKELLIVIDSLELGMQAASGDSAEVATLRQGGEMTIKQFSAVFAKFNIVAIDPLGEVFDPQKHQAMTVQTDNKALANTVLTVLQKGYTLNERLLRPAMVIVSKQDTAAADSDE